MKVNKMRNCGIAERYSEGAGLLKTPGDYVVVVRGVPRSVLILCPDGCGETISVNLDHRSGPAWRRYERNGQTTLYPSVWKQDGCRAHFIVWNDKILWCDVRGAARVESISEDFITLVLETLPNETIDYRILAERLDAIPWDVHWACEELIRRGQAILGSKQGEYRRSLIPDAVSRINTKV